MLFNSIEFLIFFIIVFILYWFVTNKNLKVQNALLLISSYVFYGWWDWRFLSLIIISSFVDFLLAKKIVATAESKKRKLLLYCSIFVNLGFLGVFKYYNFFVDSFINLLSQFDINTNFRTLNIILPVGISFYTFQTLSYTIDVYKKKMSTTNDMLSFFTFVAFFPQLVAGPIERAKHLLPQFEKKRVFDYETVKKGGQLILIGFFKKIVIADSLAVLVDAVYNNLESYTGFPMVVATLFFAFQIYCDFSGYSDIAIGTARLMGFDLMTNFRQPYFSTSLTEFWRRWHISLSTWFRDYVYIPLGGSRVYNPRVYINIFLTFLLSGLWHGANWTFVIWGAIHGFVLVIEKMTFKKIESENKFLHLSRMALTFLIVCVAWVFFRSNNINDAFFILSNMFSDISEWTNLTSLSLKFRGMGIPEKEIFNTIILLAVLILIDMVLNISKAIDFIKKTTLLRWSLYFFILFAIVFSATKNTAGNFIYFQF